jgi:hypothetical protein
LCPFFQSSFWHLSPQYILRLQPLQRPKLDMHSDAVMLQLKHWSTNSLLRCFSFQLHS